MSDYDQREQRVQNQLNADLAQISEIKFIGHQYNGLSGEAAKQIIDTFLGHISKDYLKKPDNLDSMVSSFLDNLEKMYEYKELHNWVNEILIIFGQFKEEVNTSNSRRAIPKLRRLKLLWKPVSLHVGLLLKWSEKIKFIGKPYKEFEDKSREGEDWSIQFSVIRTDIDNHLGLNSMNHTDYPNKIQILAFRTLGGEILWWENLNEFTSSFNDTSSSLMTWADKQLRQTAQDLFNLSKEALLKN